MIEAYDDGYWAFAADALLERLDAVAQEADGVRRGEDIEYVHRMRVASRRLRSALAIFDACLTEGGLGGFKKPVRRITQELGTARDLDVQIEFLNDFEKQHPDGILREGIDRLLLRLRQRRAQAQSRVVREIDRLTSSVLWTEMQQPLQELSTRSKLRGVKKDSRVLRAQARSAISGGIDAMLALERFVPQAEKTEEHHQMRIAAKKLRYTLEIFSPLYESGFKESLDSAKETQKRLGEIHDCDVWVQFLNDFLEQERERTVEYFGHDQLMQRLAPGIEFLRQDRAALRATAYQEFVAFWNESRQKNTWDELRRSIAVRAATQSGKDPAAASEQAPAENTNRPIQV